MSTDAFLVPPAPPAPYAPAPPAPDFVDDDRPVIIRAEVTSDDAGNFRPSHPLSARVGDLIELGGFSYPVYPRKSINLDVSVEGNSIRLDGVRSIRCLRDGEPDRGETNLAAVLKAEKSGRSIVNVIVTAADRPEPSALAYIVNVD